MRGKVFFLIWSNIMKFNITLKITFVKQSPFGGCRDGDLGFAYIGHTGLGTSCISLIVHNYQ